jgi:hypothetical protein
MRQSGLADVSRRRFVCTTVRDGARQAPDQVERDSTVRGPEHAVGGGGLDHLPSPWAGFPYLPWRSIHPPYRRLGMVTISHPSSCSMP